MKKSVFLIGVLFGFVATAQNIKISADGSSPDPSAMLDIASNNKGVLIPRLNASERNGINNPANGLMVYNTDCGLLNYYDCDTWRSVGEKFTFPSFSGSDNVISGKKEVAWNDTVDVTYSVPAVDGASNYQWTVPSGATITSGVGTTSIKVTFQTGTEGYICVKAENNCGSKIQSCLQVSVEKIKFLTVGDAYGGGIIADVSGAIGSQTGLIVSLKDLSPLMEWSNIQNSVSGATSTSSGASNTQDIISQSGHTSSAAQLCRSYGAGGYNDWSLPAKDELQTLYNAKYVINNALLSAGGTSLANEFYWSSTETDSENAGLFQLGTGGFTDGTIGGIGYCTNFGESSSSFYITKFELGGINNSSSNSTYTDYTSTVSPANLIVGQNYTAKITAVTNSSNSYNAAVWIDYNDNGIFEDSEKVTYLNGKDFRSGYSFPDFTVENVQGVHRLRVMYQYGSGSSYYGSVMNPCSVVSGLTAFEVEDYLVKVGSGGNKGFKHYVRAVRSF